MWQPRNGADSQKVFIVYVEKKVVETETPEVGDVETKDCMQLKPAGAPLTTAAFWGLESDSGMGSRVKKWPTKRRISIRPYGLQHVVNIESTKGRFCVGVLSQT